MSVQQINGSYVDTEDRILFRLTTSGNEEIRLWLTRRVTATLLMIGETVAIAALEKKHPPMLAKAVDHFIQEEIQSSHNPETVFESKSKLPLGAVPVLVHDAVQAKNDPRQSNIIGIRLKLSNQQDLNLKLSQAEFEQMRSFLYLMWKKTEWGEIPEKRSPNPLGALLTPKPDSVH